MSCYVTINCGNNQPIIIDENIKLETMLLEIVNENNEIIKKQTLYNPPGTIYDYNDPETVDKNSWINKQLKNQGINIDRTHTIRVSPNNGFGLSDDTPVFDNIQISKAQQIGTVNTLVNENKKNKKVNAKCHYIGSPIIIKNTSTHCKKQNPVCLAKMSCTVGNKKYITNPSCFAKNSGTACPSALDCATQDHSSLELWHIQYPNNINDIKQPNQIKLPEATLQNQNELQYYNDESNNSQGSVK